MDKQEWIVNSHQISGYKFTVLENKGAIVYVSVLDEFEPELINWINKHFKIANQLVSLKDQATITNQQALDQLAEYLSGARKTMDFPTKMTGSAKEIKVWTELNKLQYGEIISYSELASRVGMPTAIRYVATAVGKNPLLGVIPCHRINGKNGTLNGYRGGLELKQKLQLLESQHAEKPMDPHSLTRSVET